MQKYLTARRLLPRSWVVHSRAAAVLGISLATAATLGAGAVALSPAASAARPSCAIVANPTAQNHTQCSGDLMTGANLSGRQPQLRQLE